ESLVQRVGQRALVTPQGPFQAQVWRDQGGGVHLSLVHGRWSDADEVLVRVHEPLSVLDLLEAGACGHSWGLPAALAAIQASPAGVAVLLNCGEDAAAVLARVRTETPAAPVKSAMDLRTYGVGAQILKALGVHRMKLLGSPRRMPSMTGYGLEVTGFQPAPHC
ncbi:MAG: bifunctional 3,4-dihydroxy-2-butanone-4-phosphate synthase/GTP cyclohydrolase II, partial [Roseateles sp.]